MIMSDNGLEQKTQVLSFKYAPKRGNWDDILGNDEKIRVLRAKTIHDMDNYAFLGYEGVGKSLCAKMIGDTIFNGNYIVLNMSLEGNMETVKTKILKYCNTSGIEGGRKLAIFEEADNISFKAQQALREPMEKFKKTVVFIITANYAGKILPAILSRCCPMQFSLVPDVHVEKFARKIIEGEKIKATDEQIKEIVRLAGGKMRNVATMIAGWTANKTLMIESRKPVIDQLKNLFSFVRKRDIDGALNLMDSILRLTNDRVIVTELTSLIRKNDKMPSDYKMKAMVITCEAYSNIVNGVDTETSLFNMLSKMILNFPTTVKPVTKPAVKQTT